MQALFDEEARKYDVYPLDDRFAERASVADRPSVTAGRSRFIYFPGTVRVPEGSAPNLKARSHRIVAEFTVHGDHAEGVIVAAGGSAGYSLFVKDGRLMYENNFFGKERDLIRADQPLPQGRVTATFAYTQESRDYAGGGTGRLYMNDQLVGQMAFAHVPPARYSATESFDIGMDLGEPASTQYASPFPFNQDLRQVEIDVDPTRRTELIERDTRKAENAVRDGLE